ncbi:Hypothetical protein PBC10988_39840 [Planctomycetales bacterium 10988]|nr:Hypothetical protein PBC10988_39840 [Planctomycetales bacterium 10988]
MTEEPSVSVIIRTIQSRHHLLREAIESVLLQSYPSIEILIIEDGSDVAKEMVEAIVPYKPSHTIRYFSIPHAGRCAAGNFGLEQAAGEFINFLDDDDQLYPTHVESILSAILKTGGAIAGYADSEEIPTQFHSLEPLNYQVGKKKRIRPGNFSRMELWCRNYLPIQSILFKRELFLKYGGFDLELDCLEDWNLWIRYLSEGEVVYIPEVTSFYRVPINKQDRQKRNQAFDRYRPLAEEKNRQVKVNLTIGELLATSHEFTNKLHLQPVTVAVLQRKVKSSRWLFSLLAYLGQSFERLIQGLRKVRHLQ